MKAERQEVKTRVKKGKKAKRQGQARRGGANNRGKEKRDWNFRKRTEWSRGRRRKSKEEEQEPI